MIDCYNFDYNDKKQVNKILSEIDHEIQFCFQNYIVDIVNGKKEFANPIIIDTTNGYNITELNPRRKNFSDDYAKDFDKLFTKEYPKPEDWDELGAAEKASTIKELVFRLEFEEKNKSDKLKNDKKIESIIKENAEHIKKTRSYIMFLLMLRSEAIDKKNYTLLEEEEKQFSNLINKYNAKIENLITIENMFDSANSAILSVRDMLDPEYTAKTKIMIEYDIINANYLLKQTKNPTNERYKNKKNLMFAMCDSYSKLNSDKNTIDEMINITRALITKELNDSYKENEKRVNIIEKLKRNEDNVQHHNKQMIYMFLNRELMKQTSAKFFNDNELFSSAERLAQLQALRLSTINTMEELKDYLIKNRSEIKMEKTPDGKVEITIGREGELDSKLSANGKTEIENKYLGGNTTITYIYDPMNRELEGYKLSGQAYIFSKDMNNEIGKKLTNEFNMFLGNLEASTNIPIFTMFNLQIPIPNGTNIEANILNIKDKLKSKIKNNLNLDINTTVKAGNLSIENFSIKPSVLDLSITPEVSSEKYKIKMPSLKESVESIFKEGTSFSDLFMTKIASTYFNASMTGLVNDLKIVLGKSDNKIITLDYNKDSKCLQLTNVKGYLEDKQEMLKDANEKIRLMYSVIKKDSAVIDSIIKSNPEILSNNFNDKTRYEQLFECFKNMYNSLKDIKSTITSTIDTISNTKELSDNIKNKKFNKLFDNFRKNEDIFTINESTTIDNSLVDERLAILLTLKLENTDLKQISYLLEKTNNPESFYEDIRHAINNNSQEVKDYLQPVYSNIVTKKFEELIKNKDVNNIYKLLTTKDFDTEITKALKNSKKSDMIFMLSSLMEKTNKSHDSLRLDDLIEQNKKSINKYAPHILKDDAR